MIKTGKECKVKGNDHCIIMCVNQRVCIKLI